MNNFDLNKKFGFGCMRLPLKITGVDIKQTREMVDEFIKNGFNYFDTAHGYLLGRSEKAIKKCLTSRYPREAYLLTNKLTQPYFKKNEDIRPFFQKQLNICGVEYFDFYLMHAQNKEIFEHFKRCRAYETAFELKAEGKIKHVGISFHDRAEVLDRILTEYPQLEVVQIQYNYLDYDDPAVQSKKVYDVCVKHGKPVIVMEPVKGGSLVKLPDDALSVIKEAKLDPAALALRFAAEPENVIMVLSGMSSIEQMRANLSAMKEYSPLTDKEKQAVSRVTEIMKSKNMIACTACRYCVEGCPKNIDIPNLFSCMNAKKHFHDWNAAFYYSSVYTKRNGKAKDCIGCGKCEQACPQKLPIRALLKEVSKTFDGPFPH